MGVRTPKPLAKDLDEECGNSVILTHQAMDVCGRNHSDVGLTDRNGIRGSVETIQHSHFAKHILRPQKSQGEFPTFGIENADANGAAFDDPQKRPGLTPTQNCLPL